MAYTLNNKYAKNCCKWTILIQVIIEDVVTCLFWNTVYIKYNFYLKSLLVLPYN